MIAAAVAVVILVHMIMLIVAVAVIVVVIYTAMNETTVPDRAIATSARIGCM